MISFTNVTKQYGAQVLFVDASFQVNPGEKVGLVGANGSGKTTLFRLITGEETADEGAVERPKKLTIGYFRQDTGDLKGRSVLAETVAGAGEVAALGEELAKRCCTSPKRSIFGLSPEQVADDVGKLSGG